MSDPRRYRVLFVCVGNSCRSQMAEAFAREQHPDVIEPSSAGLLPARIVQPETITVMAEKNISVEQQVPKPIRDVDWKSMDLVVNMSGTGILQMLPGFRGGNLIWAVDDPMGHSLRTHRRVRDRVETLVAELAENLRRGPDSSPPSQADPEGSTFLGM